MVVDIDTPILRNLIVNGKLIFDNEEDAVTLNSKIIVISKTGSILAGTESDPYIHKSKIVLHGEPN